MRRAMATWLCESVLSISTTRLMWKPIWWVAITTTKFLRGSVVSLKARSDLAQLTPLPSRRRLGREKVWISITSAQCIISQ